MTTESWSFAVDHQSDAAFRLWGADFSARLAAVGLVQTADTGQIDWVTVTRPAINTDAGYEVWRFDDALQSSAPIFLKFYYGTGAAATRPRIRWELGTGSNGSGTLTGILVSVIEMSNGNGTATGVSQQNFFSHSAGFLALIWCRDGATANMPRAALVLCRSCDANGDPDARGAWFLWGNASGLYTAVSGELCGANGSVNFDTATAFYTTGTGTAQSCAGVMPGPTILSSLDAAGDTMAYPAFGAFPHMFPVFGYCAVWNADVTPLGTFAAAIVGATARTFLNIGIGSGSGSPIYSLQEAARDDIGHSILWE